MIGGTRKKEEPRRPYEGVHTPAYNDLLAAPAVACDCGWTYRGSDVYDCSMEWLNHAMDKDARI